MTDPATMSREGNPPGGPPRPGLVKRMRGRGDRYILPAVLPRFRSASVAPSCDACSASIEGEPAGRGLLLFPRGDVLVREEPPLCEQCALAIGMTALFRFEEEEDEG